MSQSYDEYLSWYFREVERLLDALSEEDKRLLVAALERNAEVKSAAAREAEVEAVVARQTLETVRAGRNPGIAAQYAVTDYAQHLMDRRQTAESLNSRPLSPDAEAYFDATGERDFGVEDFAELWAVDALCKKLDPEHDEEEDAA